MGNSPSSNEDNAAVELQSDDVDKKVQEEEDDDLSDPIQHLYYLLRKPVVDDAEVKAILNAEGEAKLDLNVADLPPTIDPNGTPGHRACLTPPEAMAPFFLPPPSFSLSS
jgi:hypothetical protein